MSDDKPVIEMLVSDVETAFVSPDDAGDVLIMLNLPNSREDIVWRLTPKALSSLESKLASMREFQAAKRLPQ